MSRSGKPKVQRQVLFCFVFVFCFGKKRTIESAELIIISGNSIVDSAHLKGAVVMQIRHVGNCGIHL